MPGIPILKTTRLILRPVTPDDFAALHEIHERGFGDGSRFQTTEGLANSQKILEWIQLNEWFPRLRWWNTRLIELKESHTVIGEIALVPMPLPFDAIMAGADGAKSEPIQTMELSMLWGVLPEYRRQGYASEAAATLIDFAFAQFNLKRIVAHTEHNNLASQAVMRRLGMRLYQNRLAAFDWLEVIGVLENPSLKPS